MACYSLTEKVVCNSQQQEETVMKPPWGTELRIGGVLGGIGLLALLTGCAFTTDHIVITYTPDQNVAKIQGAEAVNLKIEFIDARTTKNQVGSKKNGYGMETAPIVATNDMAILFSDVIQTELKSRGFIIGNGPVQVIIELLQVPSLVQKEILEKVRL